MHAARNPREGDRTQQQRDEKLDQSHRGFNGVMDVIGGP
jgi:hypothetical protein